MVLEKTSESQLDSKGIKQVDLKGDRSWIFTGRTDAEAEAPVFWLSDVNRWLVEKNPWCWERLRAEEEGVSGWDGWMSSPMQWTWTWANSGRWWGTGRPGVLQSMGSQRVGHDWATEHHHHQNLDSVDMWKSSQFCLSPSRGLNQVYSLRNVLPPLSSSSPPSSSPPSSSPPSSSSSLNPLHFLLTSAWAVTQY